MDKIFTVKELQFHLNKNFNLEAGSQGSFYRSLGIQLKTLDENKYIEIMPKIAYTKGQFTQNKPSLVCTSKQKLKDIDDKTES